MAIPAQFRSWLLERFGKSARFSEPMSRHTSLGVGGPAEAWVAAPDVEGLSALVKKMSESEVPWRVVGRGTNLLVSDKGIDSVVITLGRGFTGISHVWQEEGRVAVGSGAGASLSALCRYAQKEGFTGMNFAVGIPGSVGGAVAGNAGTALGCVADSLTGISLMLPDSTVRHIGKSELDFSYRHLSKPKELWGKPGNESIITEAFFALSPGNPEEIAAEAALLLARRKSTQPWGAKSAGCFFKNPQGQSAGALIDRAGLKGKRVGGALVSTVHANFLVNEGNATAADFFELMSLVQSRIRERHGVDLVPEIITP